MTKKSILLAGAALLALAACEPTGYNTFDTGDQNPRTKTGAAIGGVLGGLIGASSSNDKLAKGVVGAGIGAALGGVIGQQLDRQAADLRRDVSNDNIRIENTGSELRLTTPQDLLFATDSATVRPDLQGDLRAIAVNLNQYPNSSVIITGHTDDTGSQAYNDDLSQRRAAAVGSVLTNAGVAFNRVRTFGRGEDQPIASNSSASGRAQNRRVEIVIRPNT